MENLGLRSQPKGQLPLMHPRWTASEARVNLPRQLILAVAVFTVSAVLEDHF